MIFGKYKYSLDSKGRINFKKILDRFLKRDVKKEEVFYLFKDFVSIPGKEVDYPVVYLFTEESWIEFYEQMEIDMEDDDMSAFSSHCNEASLDKVNRVSFPKAILGYIGAEKDIFIQGMGTKLQVWSLENHEQYDAKLESRERPAKKFHGLINKSKKARSLT